MFQIVLHAPTRTHTQEVEVIKLFRTRTHTQVEYKLVDTWVSSIAYNNTQICFWAEFNKCLKFYFSVSIIICLHAFILFSGEERGGGVCTYKHINYILNSYMHMYTRGENHIYMLIDITINTWHMSILCGYFTSIEIM